MASVVVFDRLRRQQRRRQHVHRTFRDHTNPIDIYSDVKIFPRIVILDLCESVREDLDFVLPRKGSLTPILQLLIALRFYATGSFQDHLSEMIGVSQATVCRTVKRVTDVLCSLAGREFRLPTQHEARRTKASFYRMARFPNVIGCIDGTHVRIQGPTEQEHEYVNRKGFHSINVQVICDADLMFLNVVAKWPGSVHDAKMLRESHIFTLFEGPRPPVDGVILADSGYMQRTWLMTPLTNPTNRQERSYNNAHASTRSTVERCIGVAKQRWSCLRFGLRLEPAKACRVITVCLMLHNIARRQSVPEAPPDSSDSDSDREEGTDSSPGNSDDERESNQIPPTPIPIPERTRLASGKRARNRIINTCF